MKVMLPIATDTLTLDAFPHAPPLSRIDDSADFGELSLRTRPATGIVSVMQSLLEQV